MLNNKIATIIATIINIVMVGVVYLAIINDITVVAFLALLASKWRMFAAHPRHWPRNFVKNTCDISVGIAIIALLEYYYQRQLAITVSGVEAGNAVMLGLIGFYFLWQIIIKTLRTQNAVALQSLLCFSLSMTAIWSYYPTRIEFGFVPLALSGLVSFVAAYHLLRQTDTFEGRVTLYSFIWTTIALELSWISWLWNVQYVVSPLQVVIPQIAITGALTGYYLFSITNITARLKKERHKLFVQQTLFYGALMVIVIGFSQWSGSIY